MKIISPRISDLTVKNIARGISDHEKLVSVEIECDRDSALKLKDDATVYILEQDTYGAELTFVKPEGISDESLQELYEFWKNVEKVYFSLLKTCGADIAKLVIPPSIKETVVVTGPWSELKDFLNEFGEKTPQRNNEILSDLKSKVDNKIKLGELS